MKRKYVEYEHGIDDTVYFVNLDQFSHESKCSTCLGEGTITRKDKTAIECPTCKGKKVVSDSGGGLKYVVHSGVIDEIIINLRKMDDGSVRETIECRVISDVEQLLKTTFEEDSLYPSLKLAEEQCVKSNSGCVMGYTT